MIPRLWHDKDEIQTYLNTIARFDYDKPYDELTKKEQEIVWKKFQRMQKRAVQGGA